MKGVLTLQKYNILNRTLDIWEKENLTENEAKEKLKALYLEELKKPKEEWRYKYEIRRSDNK